MAPSSLAVGGYARGASLATRSVILARQTHMQWAPEDQERLATIVGPDGQFNGTCSASDSGLAPQPNAGECESYYADVTVYCCGAVGGSIRNITQQGTTDMDGDGSVEASDTSMEPSCQTTNLDDMLLCYKYTAEEHCRSAVSGPWGVCNMADDSSPSTSGSSPFASNSSTSAQQSGGSTSAAARTDVTRFQTTVVAGLVLVSMLVVIIGEASI